MKRAKKERWSGEDTRLLKQLVKENVSTREIGLKLGRSVGNIRVMAEKMSVPLKPARTAPVRH